MLRYDPIQHLPMGSRTLGTMEAHQEGDWVHHSDYAELLSDLALALSWIEDGCEEPDYQEAMDRIVTPMRAKHDFEALRARETIV